MVRRLQNWWQCLSRKQIVLGVFALTIGLAFGVSFFLGRSSKLNGMWKINPNAMPGYGMCLEIDGGSISASGDLVNYYGFMDFNYEVLNDHQLILTYDWNFGQGWPWNIAYIGLLIGVLGIFLQFWMDQENAAGRGQRSENLTAAGISENVRGRFSKTAFSKSFGETSAQLSSGTPA